MDLDGVEAGFAGAAGGDSELLGDLVQPRRRRCVLLTACRRSARLHAMDRIENPVPDCRLAAAFEALVRNLAKRKPTKVSSPAKVVAVAPRAATDSRPRPHYEINNMKALKVAAALPPRLVDFTVHRMIRHGGQPQPLPCS